MVLFVPPHSSEIFVTSEAPDQIGAARVQRNFKISFKV